MAKQVNSYWNMVDYPASERGDPPSLPWNRPPRTVQAGSIKHLRLLTDNSRHKDLPAVIRRFTDLEALDVPARMASKLHAHTHLARLKALTIDDDLPGECEFDASLHLRALRELNIRARKCRPFSHLQFPKLKGLEIKWNSGKHVAETIEAFGRLERLTSGPISSRALLETAARVRPKQLHLAGGTISSLEGIEDKDSIEFLDLRVLDKFTSLTPLAKLPRLRRLKMYWCKRVDLSGVFRLRGLEVLELYQANQPQLDQLRTRLEALNMDVRLLS